MKTLSPTEARANMTRWLDEAVSGKSIGITHKGYIIKLQPVAVTEDWAAEEYGLTAAEMDAIAANLLKSGDELLDSEKTIPWNKVKKRRRRC